MLIVIILAVAVVARVLYNLTHPSDWKKERDRIERLRKYYGED